MKSCVNDRGVASNGGLLDSLIRRNELWEQGQQTFGEGCEGRGTDFSRPGSNWYSRPLIPRRSAARANFPAFLFWQTVFSPMGFSAQLSVLYLASLHPLFNIRRTLLSIPPYPDSHRYRVWTDVEMHERHQNSPSASVPFPLLGDPDKNGADVAELAKEIG